ncbi:MAG: putative N-acetylmannosamine-6-phosphate 2-epimerase [Chlorobiota bacterium]|nr:putative N-acetylmannosamine-6-phosphate 2-epimerase [Chlorobiota bacterium]QQS65595.1 MAG: putative N-acetylmannosamine-6-phosphate 2-epimerase [Chlorobiota bacterium]
MILFKDIIPKGLIVSCQLDNKEPFYTPQHCALFAVAAEKGGAIAVRADGVLNIQEIRASSKLPIIGCIREKQLDDQIVSTPNVSAIDKLIRSGSNVIAIDATKRIRPDLSTGSKFFKDIRDLYPKLILLADISTFEEGVLAAEAGANAISTVLFGRTPETIELAHSTQEYFKLINKLSITVKVPILAEGFIFTIEEAVEAIKNGAYSCIVGAAITRPRIISQLFSDSISRVIN